MTTDHILKLAKLGGYNSNHFFRVDKGFVAQTASIMGGRLAPLDRKLRVCHIAAVVLASTTFLHQCRA